MQDAYKIMTFSYKISCNARKKTFSCMNVQAHLALNCFHWDIATYLAMCCSSYCMWINICDQICQKGSYTRTVSIHTFHRHLLATSMHQQDMCLLLLKVEQSAFHSGLLLKPVWHPRVLG